VNTSNNNVELEVKNSRLETKGAARKSGRMITAALAASVASVAIAAPAFALSATVQNLNDKNSTLTIDYTANTLPTPPNGVENWTVDGVNVLNREWFWGGTTTLTSINNFAPSVLVAPTNILGDGAANNNYTKLQYVDPSNPVTIQVGFSLVGGAPGSKASDLAETVLLTNTGATPIDYQFDVYSDFSMGGSTNGETATITGGNTAKVTNPGGIELSETVVSPKPSEYETDAAPALLNKLDAAALLTMNTSGGALSTKTTLTGDAEWGFQWNMNLAPGASAVVSIDKQVAVPEPASAVALIAVGGILMTRRRRAAIAAK